MSTAVKSLAANGVMTSRDRWMDIATSAESAQAPVTCGAIVRCTIGLGVEKADRKRTWMADAGSLERKGFTAAARAVYAHALACMPTKKSIWLRAAALEKKHGDHADLLALLTRAVKQCPTVRMHCR